MRFLIIAVALLVTSAAQAFPFDHSVNQITRAVSIIPVHGCHQTYGRDLRGWHRHGKHCETQRGIAKRFKRNGQKTAI